MVVEVKGEKLEVFDVHTHMGGGKYFRDMMGIPSYLGKEFIEGIDEAGVVIKGMDESGVDRVVAFPTAHPLSDYSEANKIIVEEAKKYPKRIIGFARLNPNFGPDKTKEIIDTYVGKLGMRGIKLHPYLDAFDMVSRSLVCPIFEGAKKYKVPVLIHTGEFYPTPTLAADIASEYPEVPTILAHMGERNWWQDAIIVAKRQDNLFLDTAVIGWMQPIIMAIKTLGASRILFGSDYPYQPYEKEIANITKHSRAKIDEMRLILAENIKSILKIK